MIKKLGLYNCIFSPHLGTTWQINHQLCLRRRKDSHYVHIFTIHFLIRNIISPLISENVLFVQRRSNEYLLIYEEARQNAFEQLL